MYKISLEPGERMLAELDMVGADGALYVVTDCTDEATCVSGGDRTMGLGMEAVQYTNLSPAPVEVFLVIDSADPGGWDTFLLDVKIEVAGAITPFADVCLEAAYGGPIPPGTYLTTLEGYSDDVNGGACLGYATAGPDSMVKVEIPAGKRLKASNDLGLPMYLTADCEDPTPACEASADGAGSALVWTNPVAFDAELFLVLDDEGITAPPSAVGVTIDYQDPITLGDTCADAAILDPLGTGRLDTFGDLTPYAEDMDLEKPGPSCTGFGSWGPDGILPVHLEDGETIDVEYTMSFLGADTSMYLLSTCGDTTSTVACSDTYLGYEYISPEVMTYTNTTGAPEDLWLVLDVFGTEIAYLPYLVSAPPGPFDLLVDIY
jgi:hypothetical protein